MTNGRKDSLTGKTGANGGYSIEMPIGNVEIWSPELPPGYWSENRLENIVTSAEAPVVTKDFLVHRGPVWRVRAWDATAARPIPAIQCVVNGNSSSSWSNTNAEGIARVTLQGFRGVFQLRVCDFEQPGRWQVGVASLAVEPGFRVDRVSQITAHFLCTATWPCHSRPPMPEAGQRRHCASARVSGLSAPSTWSVARH